MARNAASLTIILGAGDLIGPECHRLLLDEVPECPVWAERTTEPNGDTIVDVADFRWRFSASGNLKFYCRYYPKEERQKHGPWAEAYAV